jgi:hypothetical protein
MWQELSLLFVELALADQIVGLALADQLVVLFVELALADQLVVLFVELALADQIVGHVEELLAELGAPDAVHDQVGRRVDDLEPI